MKRLLAFLILAASGLLVYKIGLSSLPVVAHTVSHGQVVSEVMGTGTLEARVKTTVSPRIQERLLEVRVDQGDAVKKGQLLARLDDAEATQQVAIARATLDAAKRTAERVGADLERSEAVATQARLNERRLAGLLETRAVAQADLDKAQEGLQVAEADLKRSRAAIAEAGGQILVAEKSLLYQQERLAFTTIHAPYDGLVIRRDRDPGEMLVPGASLLEIISLDEIWIRAWVDETAMPGLAAGQQARVVFRSEPGRGYPGKVSRLGRESDRETREFLIDVHLAELPANWTVGQRAEVFIETGRQGDAVLLPATFVVRRQGEVGVMVEREGKARWQAVTLGLAGSGQFAVTGGLEPGTTVVKAIDGKLPPLKDGQRVAVP